MFSSKADELMNSSETDLKNALEAVVDSFHDELLRRNSAGMHKKLVARKLHGRYYDFREAKKTRKTKSKI